MKYNEFVETVRVEVEKLCPFDMVDVKKIMKLIPNLKIIPTPQPKISL